MLQNLKLATLGELNDGQAEAIINAAIRTAVEDLDDRGTDKKPRTVEIKLALTQLDNGQVAAHVEAHAKVPPRRTAGSFCDLRRTPNGAGLHFQSMDPSDPQQTCIDDHIAREKAQGELAS